MRQALSPGSALSPYERYGCGQRLPGAWAATCPALPMGQGRRALGVGGDQCARAAIPMPSACRHTVPQVVTREHPALPQPGDGPRDYRDEEAARFHWARCWSGAPPKSGTGEMTLALGGPLTGEQYGAGNATTSRMEAKSHLLHAPMRQSGSTSPGWCCRAPPGGAQWC